MEEIQELHPIIFPFLISLFLLFSITKCFTKPTLNNKTLPPSPRNLPILGNLHQVGTLPHRSLQILANKHGPLMLLRFGSVPVLVASSAAAAREILRTHDHNFSDRPEIKAFKKLLYNGKDVAFAPYGEHWRQLKSIFVLQLLSSQRVQSFRPIRERETALFVEKVREFAANALPMNLTAMFFEFAVDGICISAFGVKYSESENGKKFLVLLQDLMELLGTISVGDFVPCLSWISSINGVDKRMDRVAKEVDDCMEGVIQERIDNKSKKSENFLDILLEIYEGKASGDHLPMIDRDDIKASLLDAVAAGTSAVSSVLEWLMTELLQHSNVMEKLQNEVREIVQDKEEITDSDLGKMCYLKAVIKETLRYQPPVPLVGPRISGKDVKIMGYDVPTGTMMLANAWAIGRDPGSWDEPEKFEPERFLNSSIDCKGFNFELIPFGSGRRRCPGVLYTLATIEFLVANLVQKFNWELCDGAQEKDLDITSELAGITLRRGVPLLAVATPAKL